MRARVADSNGYYIIHHLLLHDPTGTHAQSGGNDMARRQRGLEFSAMEGNDMYVCMYVSIYKSTASTWTLASPRATWEFMLRTNSPMGTIVPAAA